jgi:hypothetical protein
MEVVFQFKETCFKFGIKLSKNGYYKNTVLAFPGVIGSGSLSTTSPGYTEADLEGACGACGACATPKIRKAYVIQR